MIKYTCSWSEIGTPISSGSPLDKYKSEQGIIAADNNFTKTLELMTVDILKLTTNEIRGSTRCISDLSIHGS